MGPESESNLRPDGRKPAELRDVRIEPGVNRYAEGSAEIWFGRTHVHVAVSVEKELPPWMKPKDGSPLSGGWVTAEYGMLPRATHTRNRREASAGKQGGRTLEIQRLIGRSARAALDLSMLKGVTLKIDCDVITADGGTRTASITGAWVALAQALAWAKKNDLADPAAGLAPVAAVSVGLVGGRQLLDLCYDEDSEAEFDLNLIFNDRKDLIEIQGTAEQRPVSVEQLQLLVELGWTGVQTLLRLQQAAVKNYL